MLWLWATSPTTASPLPIGEGCGFVPLPLPCGRYYLPAGREAPPYRFVQYQTYYPHSNQLFIIHQRSDFIIHCSLFFSHRTTDLCHVLTMIKTIHSNRAIRESPLQFVPLPLPCDRYCLSAGREAPPYDLYLGFAVIKT